MTRIYLDAAPVIYFVQKVIPYYASVVARLTPPDIVRVVSDLTRMECRVGPLRTGDVAQLGDYDAYFRADVHEIITLSTAILDRAAEIRATYRFKTPDAIHLAAVEAACDVFLTNDHGLTSFTGITVEVVPP